MSEGHCEARIDSRRENAKGVFITFLVHPDEVSKLDGLRAGSTVVLGWAETVNANVEKIEIQGDCSTAENVAASTNGRSSDFDSESSRSNREAVAKPKRAFRDMPLSQQAGIRCGENAFQGFLSERYGKVWATCDDAATKFGGKALAEIAAACIYAIFGIESRRALNEGRPALLWIELNKEFEAWELTQRYAESVRR